MRLREYIISQIVREPDHWSKRRRAFEEILEYIEARSVEDILGDSFDDLLQAKEKEKNQKVSHFINAAQHRVWGAIDTGGGMKNSLSCGE